ncbi:hypothetical protein DL767_002285 [Monosporascus sp. MG133]|nr:hypothetical protein DL767_002285 [Monosporascus sp. MG133]
MASELRLDANLLTIDPSKTIPSVKSFVRERLGWKWMDESLRQKAEWSICAYAQGNWLVAALALNGVFKAKTISAVERQIEDLTSGRGPPNLSELYRKILLRLESDFEDEDDLDRAQTIWAWVIFSRLGRPLFLHELATALLLRATIRKEERDGVEWQTTVDTGENLFDPKAEILRLCSPLLEIDEDGLVHVVHYSVKEYFLTTSDSSTPESSGSHRPAVLIPEWQRVTRLAFSSLRYLELDEIQSDCELWQSLLERDKQGFQRIASFFTQSLLPIWDFLGDYNYRLALLLMSTEVSENITLPKSRLSKFYDFLYSARCIPWILGSLALFGIHDVSVLLTRIGLAAALAKDEHGRGPVEGIWELVLPHLKLRLWVENFYIFAIQQQWDFKVYEIVALGKPWGGVASSTGGEGSSKDRVYRQAEEALMGSQESGKTIPRLMSKANLVNPAFQAQLSKIFQLLGEQAAHTCFEHHPSECYYDPLSPLSAIDPRLHAIPALHASATSETLPTVSASEIAVIVSERLKGFADVNKEHTTEYERAKQLFYEGKWDVAWASMKPSRRYRSKRMAGSVSICRANDKDTPFIRSVVAEAIRDSDFMTVLDMLK